MKDVKSMREYFETGITRDAEFRLARLRLLRQAVENRAGALEACLREDLGKSVFESYATEIGLLYREISSAERRLNKWMKPKRAGTGLVNFPSKGRVIPEPKGVVLIFSPWNYPIQLSLVPLCQAISAGNCAVVTLSEKCPATSKCIEKLISDNFDPKFVRAVVGNVAENQRLLSEKFDHIFFTGSTRVGKIVYEAAAKQLVPVTLELGGKSPCIVDATANLAVAARRIVWGKCLNCGQTCVAPDYALVERSVLEPFAEELKKAYLAQYPEGIGSPDYGKIVDGAGFDRLEGLTEGQTVLFEGGKADREARKFPFTVLTPSADAPVMAEEIFGPILPLVPFDSLAAVRQEIEKHPTPLACYVFSKNRHNVAEILKVPFGGGCVNDTVSHLVSEKLPFGGVGSSGIGSYHGYRGFCEFSHFKSVLIRPKLELKLKYPPYRRRDRTVRKILK